jgi:HK97 family phage major capsid protein
MKLTINEFTTSILPGLRAQHQVADKLKAAIGDFLKSNEIQDADGNAIALETLVLELPADEKKGATTPPVTQETIDKAVAEAIKKLNPKASPDNGGSDKKEPAIPATVKRYGALKNFKGPDADEKAYKFGKFCLATWNGGGPASENARKYCEEHGLIGKAQSETVNTAGGFLVPTEFENSLIDLRLQYGVFRRNARIVPMASDTKVIPRRTGGLTAYFVAENAAITESDKTWDQVGLTAHKLATLTRYSSELGEDALIDVGDDLAGEIAYAFAQMEDACGFIGDGTSTYGGMQGASPRILGLDATVANIAGIRVQGVTGAWANFTLNDYGDLVGRLPSYAYQPGKVKWYCHPNLYGGSMAPLAFAAGGTPASEVVNGVATKKFLGFPVEDVNVLPSAIGTADAIVALFGNLELAAAFGDRRQTTIAMSSDRYFDTDQIAVRGTERFDINVHDVGNASATAALRVPGPIVALYNDIA